MTPPATTPANRKPRFNKWDLAIFLVLPLVLLGGFLLFMHLKRTAADPNLRLIAQVTDDITVELVAVASQSRQNDGSVKWWKPNGLLALDIREDPYGSKAGTGQTGFCFLYTYSDERPGKNAVVRGSAATVADEWSMTRVSDDGKTVVVTTNATPDIWSSFNSGVRISTEGIQYVGELTPERAKLTTSVGGPFATAQVLDGEELSSVTGFHPSPGVLRITEPIETERKINSQFSVEIFDEAGKTDTSISMELGQRNNEYQHMYYFNSRTWSRIVIHRTVFDVRVTFDGIASQPDSITSPRVGEISRLRDK